MEIEKQYFEPGDLEKYFDIDIYLDRTTTYDVDGVGLLENIENAGDQTDLEKSDKINETSEIVDQIELEKLRNEKIELDNAIIYEMIMEVILKELRRRRLIVKGRENWHCDESSFYEHPIDKEVRRKKLNEFNKKISSTLMICNTFSEIIVDYKENYENESRFNYCGYTEISIPAVPLLINGKIVHVFSPMNESDNDRYTLMDTDYKNHLDKKF